jgi:hypothetical protein
MNIEPPGSPPLHGAQRKAPRAGRPLPRGSYAYTSTNKDQCEALRIAILAQRAIETTPHRQARWRAREPTTRPPTTHTQDDEPAGEHASLIGAVDPKH